MATNPDFDAIILAGGASSRMGSDKALITIGGDALLRRAYRAVGGARMVVAVAPAGTVREAFPQGIPGNLTQTLERPKLGGPVAGIAAGLDRLGDDCAGRVAILACDLPHAAGVMEILLARLAELDDGADALCAVDDQGWEQWLMGVYSRDFLLRRRARIGEGRGVAVRTFVKGARSIPIRVDRGLTADVDTPEDLKAITESMEESA